MLFSSVTFLFVFLPIVVAAYFILPQKYRNIVLLIASLIFYAWGEPIYVFLMILSIIFNFACGHDIEQKKGDKKAVRNSLIMAIAVNLLLLGFYKYSGFFVDIINRIFSSHIAIRELSLPIGISFYTFQAISYLIDIYRGDAKSQKNILNFALYISMFPQLIAGPIVRYTDIEEQLENRTVSLTKFGQGIQLFLFGLAKKVIFADGIGAIFGMIQGKVLDGQSGVVLAWIGAISYMLEIYFDFSGYSDMAIGLGRMFGFQFKENFHYPYMATSITDFWRRWHISLSTWFREYVYIPLGGNRVPVSRHILNLLIVWCLTGFWHGASWNFIVWGLYYGILLILEKYIWGWALERLPKYVRHIYSLIIILIGWVFFFSNNLAEAGQYLLNMIGVHAARPSTAALYCIGSNWLLLLLGLLCSTNIPYIFASSYGVRGHKKFVVIAVDIIIFMIIIACLITNTFHPFLYFRF